MDAIVKKWNTLIVPLSFAIAILKRVSIIDSDQFISIEYQNIIEDERKIQISSTRSPFYKHELTLIPTWISKYILYKTCIEMIYQFPDFDGATVEVWEWISNLIPCFTVYIITHPCGD